MLERFGGSGSTCYGAYHHSDRVMVVREAFDDRYAPPVMRGAFLYDYYENVVLKPP
jgi:hypothetical protein